MSLWKYKYFVDVVETKSFTKAGKKNYISQTAISQQIAGLEKSMGEKLLLRGNREIRLTEFGNIVYKKSKEMLKIQEEMMQEIKALRGESVLKIGIDSSVNKIFWRSMQEIVDEFYTEQDFEFQKINRSDAERLMNDGELDIYVGYVMDCVNDHERINEWALATNSVGIHVGNSNKLLEKEVVTLNDLETYVKYVSPCYPCSIQSAIMDSDYCSDVQEVQNLDTLKIKVELNDGYMFADSYFFSYAEGEMIDVVDYNEECILKAFYRKNDSKINKFLAMIEKILNDNSKRRSA